MKSRFGLAALSVLTLTAAGTLPTQARQQQDLAARVQALETEVGDLRQLVTAMTTAQKESVDATKAYFDAQGEGAKALRASLAEAEKLGFTAGINPASREELLAGWRRYLSTLESAVPAKSKGSTDGKKRDDAK